MTKKCDNGMKKCMRESLATLSEIKWVNPINPSLKFSVSPKRFLPFLFSDAAILLIMLLMATNNAALLEAAIAGETVSAEGLGLIFTGVFIFGLWMIVNIWITGAVIHQSKNTKQYDESWRVAFRCMPTLIMALIVVSVLSFSVSVVPYIGTLLSIVIALMFLFLNQFIVLDRKSLMDSIRSSIGTFRGKMLGTFWAWLVSVVITTLMIMVFTIPLILAFYVLGTEYTGEDAITSMMMHPDATLIYVTGLVMLLGIAFSRVFALKYLTEIYVQFKKKKWLSK